MNIIKKAFNFCRDKARSFIKSVSNAVSVAKAAVVMGLAVCGTVRT